MNITETIDVDWLGQIDGKTVADAVAYLQTLDQSLRLDAYLDGGDTHGVELKSALFRGRPETAEETKRRRIKELNRAKVRLEADIAHNVKMGRVRWAEDGRKKLAFAEAELKELT